MNIKRLIINTVALLTVLASANSCLVGRYMCKFALLPEEHGNDIEGDRQKAEKRYPGIMKWYDTLHESGVFRDTTMVGEGGYMLHGVYAPACVPEQAQGTAIVIHGYTDNHICFMNLVRMYRDSLNYNVLAPDLHYHGYSEGRAVQMGWFDRLDIIRWIDLIHNVWNDDFMVIHGVSMGGATTMMVSGEELPEYVKAFVDDCGYSSVWDQYKHNLHEMFHLPPFPVLNSASIVAKQRYGWSFKEASSVAQLAKCERPMLFIHGDKDDFVPTAHVFKNYEAKTHGYKELWLAPGSEHAMAYKDYPAEYTQHVREFLQTVRNLEELSRTAPAFTAGAEKKLVAMDLDATLTQHKTPLSAENKAALDRLGEKYALVMVGGGSAERIHNQMNGYPIDILGNYGMQEARVKDGVWQVVRSEKVSADTAAVAEKCRYFREKYGFDRYYGKPVEFHESGMVTFGLLGTAAPSEEKLAFDPDKSKRRAIYKEVCEAFSDWSVFIGGSTSFDFAPKQYNKYDALMRFAEENGYAKDEIIFIGDDMEDGGNDSHIRLGGMDYIYVHDYRDFPVLIKPLLMEK